MISRRRRRGLWLLVGVALFALGMTAIAGILLNATTPSAESILHARGLPATPEEWEAWHHEDPAAPNAAQHYLSAAELYESDPEAAYAQLVEAIGYTYCRFPIDRVMTSAPDRAFRRDARALWALLEEFSREALAEGDGDRLTETMEALLALSHAMGQQPFFLDYLTASGMMTTVTRDLLPEALAAGILGENQIDRMDAGLARLEAPERAHRALLGTMAIWIRDATPIVDLPFAALAPVQWTMNITSLPGRMQAVFATDFLRIHDLLHEPYPAQREAVRGWEYSNDPVIEFIERASRSPYRIALSSAPDHFVDGVAITRGRLAAARAGLQVERYRAHHGQLPASSDALAQAGLELPEDPLGGVPIRYALDNSGYRTWSVGRNMMDNGGHEGRGRGPDLVFQVAAEGE